MPRRPRIWKNNADARLTPIGHELGLIDDVRFANFEAKYQQQQDVEAYMQSHLTKLAPFNKMLEEKETATLLHNVKLAQILLRPQS